MWLIIAAFAAFVSILGVGGYRQFLATRKLIVAGALAAITVLLIAGWLVIRDHSHVAIASCVVAAAIEEIKARQVSGKRN
jgi:hypothetical protein